MAANYAMPGFEIRVKDGILELRTDGERTEENGQDTERAFGSLVAHAQPDALLFDVREATYTLSPSRWKERAAVVARMTRDYPLAIVIRDDQLVLNNEVITRLREMGGTGKTFTTRTEARAWLLEQIRVKAGS